MTQKSKTQDSKTYHILNCFNLNWVLTQTPMPKFYYAEKNIRKEIKWQL